MIGVSPGDALRPARAGLSAICACLALLFAAPMAAAAPAVVSLQFDDGTADQWSAHDLIAARGMTATYFVNSGRPGRRGFLTFAQLHQLEAEGNEIGGHTIDHVDVPSLGADDQRREVCDDRADLLARGFQITDFAFPFGSHDAGSQAVVRDCGYNTARITSGIRSPNSCQTGCPAAETVPPRDPYATRTPDSVHADTPLSDLISDVDQTIAAGGVLQIVMHHVCDGCNANAISTSTLSGLLDYLAARRAEGRLQVATVRQAFGGDVRPAVQGPELPLPGAPYNLLQNPSLEDTGTGTDPRCFKSGGAGAATATWTRTDDAFDGVAAERVDVTALGPKSDRKLVTRQDTRVCAPRPLAGHRYRFVWAYKAAAEVRAVAYLRDEDGTWRFWAQGDPAPRASAYRRAVWTTPRVPAGTTNISVGVSLRSTGAMTLDAFLLQDVLTPLPAPPRPVAATETTRKPYEVRAGRLPLVVFGRLPADLLAAQAALQADLQLIHRAGFTPVAAKVLSRVVAGRAAGVRRPVVVAFRGGATGSLAIADQLLARDGTRAILVTSANASIRGLASRARWDVIAPSTPSGRALAGRTQPANVARISVTFRTSTAALLRKLRAAGAKPRRSS